VAKLRFSPCMGFLVAMNIWLYNLLVVCKIGVVVADNGAYALGPAASWLSSSKLAIISIGIVTMAGLMFLAWRGLALGKWINNIGGGAVVFLFLAMIVVALPRWLHGGSQSLGRCADRFRVAGAIAVQSEHSRQNGIRRLQRIRRCGVFAGECRSSDVAGSIRRSVWTAAPIIFVMFVAGTASVLTYSAPDSIDLVAPMTQVLNSGAPRLVVFQPCC